MRFLLLVLGICAAAAARVGVAGVPSARRGTIAPDTSAPDTIVSFNAGSLALPLRAALDSFAARTGTIVMQENAGSLETARKLIDLGRTPDVIALADEAVFGQLLMPRYVRWYIRFARNRMAIAYSPRSKFAREIGSENWYRILTRPGVVVGRADPSLDPNGYQTLLTLALAERYYHAPELTRTLTASPATVRPKETDLLALVELGEFDYAWSYESIAEAAGLEFVRLPAPINLGEPADSALYATVSVRVAGRTPKDSIVITGRPIVYGIAIPAGAAHPRAGRSFLAYLLSPDGARVLRAAHLDVIACPTSVGVDVPSGLSSSSSCRR